MRYVPTLCLREGMMIGKDLFGKNNQLMLAKGTIVTDRYIDSIKRVGFNGVYIHDDLSQDIEVVSTISDEIRNEAFCGIKNVFVMAEKYANNEVSNIKKYNDNFKKIDVVSATIESIIDELLASNELLVNMIDLKFFDDYTYQHSVSVTVLSIIMGISLNLDRATLQKLALSAFLHDVGKVFVNKSLLDKPEKLSQEELDEIKQHTVRGYEYLKKEFNLPVTVYMTALQHHEKFNGTGYPEGLSGDKIPLFSKIIGIADVYDALTSKRPYREAFLPSEAFEYIMGSSKTYFDPILVKLFSRKIAPYPVGTCVKLSNNWLGIVVKNYADCILRPEIRIFNKEGVSVEPYEISLNDDYNLANVTITGVEAM